MKYKVTFLETKSKGSLPVMEVIYDTDTKIISVSNINDSTYDFNDLLIDGEYIIGKGAKKYSMKDDGMTFMKNLKIAFSGSTLRATDVEKVE